VIDAVGAAVSIVRLRLPDAALALPAASKALTVSAWTPSASMPVVVMV
jgi:hypothetical protein